MNVDHSLALRGFLSCILLLLLALLGCGSHSKDDHLEHHVPEHKPRNLAGAVKEIPLRWQSLEKQWLAKDSQRQEELQQLLDIIQWMPELAGDSDLAEPDWNHVNGISKEWQATLKPLADSHANGATDKFPRWADSNQPLAELQRLAPLAANGNRVIHQGHTHD